MDQFPVIEINTRAASNARKAERRKQLRAAKKVNNPEAYEFERLRANLQRKRKYSDEKAKNPELHELHLEARRDKRKADQISDPPKYEELKKRRENFLALPANLAAVKRKAKIVNDKRSKSKMSEYRLRYYASKRETIKAKLAMKYRDSKFYRENIKRSKKMNRALARLEKLKLKLQISTLKVNNLKKQLVVEKREEERENDELLMKTFLLTKFEWNITTVEAMKIDEVRAHYKLHSIYYYQFLEQGHNEESAIKMVIEMLCRNILVEEGNGLGSKILNWTHFYQFRDSIATKEKLVEAVYCGLKTFNHGHCETFLIAPDPES